MRTLITLAIGFWLGRQIYLRYDRQEMQKKEEELQQRIDRLIEKKDMNLENIPPNTDRS